MAALVCDICGGKLTMGSGGIAVCDSCGMEHTKERMQEKVQEIKGTVRIDNSHMTDSWMKMGHAAASAGNHKEAYEYFTKVIEVDSENWRAIYEKGKAGAWQSTLGNLRTSEIYQGITLALEIINRSNLTEAEVVDLKNEFAVALFNINNAITDLMEQNLSELNDKYFDSHWDQMWNTRQRYLTNVEQLEDALSLISDLEDDLSKGNVIEFKKRMCADLKNACESIQYWTDYSESSLGYLGFSASEKQIYLDKFWSLADDIRLVEPDYATTKYSQLDPFNAGYESNRADRIMQYWQKQDDERRLKKKREAQEKRFTEYWNAHPEEKAMLEAEAQSLTQQIVVLNTEINNVPGKAEITNIQGRISKLKTDKDALSIFKGKEKKAIQEQIDAATSELNGVQSRRNAAIEDINRKIAPLEKRKVAIAEEFTKDR